VCERADVGDGVALEVEMRDVSVVGGEDGDGRQGHRVQNQRLALPHTVLTTHTQGGGEEERGGTEA
jgi:hypothetical protein